MASLGAGCAAPDLNFRRGVGRMQFLKSKKFLRREKISQDACFELHFVWYKEKFSQNAFFERQKIFVKGHIFTKCIFFELQKKFAKGKIFTKCMFGMNFA